MSHKERLHVKIMKLHINSAGTAYKLQPSKHDMLNIYVTQERYQYGVAIIKKVL